MVKPYPHLKEAFCYNCRIRAQVVNDLLPEKWHWVFFVVGNTKDGETLKAYVPMCPACHSKGMWRM
jgi:hypothetical protein